MDELDALDSGMKLEHLAEQVSVMSGVCGFGLFKRDDSVSDCGGEWFFDGGNKCNRLIGMLSGTDEGITALAFSESAFLWEPNCTVKLEAFIRVGENWREYPVASVSDVLKVGEEFPSDLRRRFVEKMKDFLLSDEAERLSLGD
jgi:hypothetical protein